MTLITKGMGVIKALKSNKKTSGSYFITDPKPKEIIIKDPDIIKLNKQIKKAKQIGVGVAGTVGAATVVGKINKNKKGKE